MVKLTIFTATMCLILAGCGHAARPVAEQEGVISLGPQRPGVPVALVPDGSAANTGNLVNGPQRSAEKK